MSEASANSADIARTLERAVGQLGTAAVQAMERDLPWFSTLSAEERSWVGLIAQHGVRSFVEWYRDRTNAPAAAGDIFAMAPRQLLRVLSLHHAVELVRTTIEVAEAHITSLVSGPEAKQLQLDMLTYSREVAFASAIAYARAAEARGAWDERLETLVMDTLLRGRAEENTLSQLAVLGWSPTAQVTVLAADPPLEDLDTRLDQLRRIARENRLEIMTALRGSSLILVLSGTGTPAEQAAIFAPALEPGHVVIGPATRGLAEIAAAAAVALAGLRAIPAWPSAPSPVLARDLLPERALTGDARAKHTLAALYRLVAAADSVLLETLAYFLEQSTSLEQCARALYVHPNTVRYRLRRVTEITGLRPNDPREGFVLRLMLGYGRLRVARPRFESEDSER